MIRYDEHALFQMERRGIEKQWVEETILDHDETETSKNGRRQSYLKCLPSRRVMLRVIVPINDAEYVISAYFDRRKPCV